MRFLGAIFSGKFSKFFRKTFLAVNFVSMKSSETPPKSFGRIQIISIFETPPHFWGFWTPGVKTVDAPGQPMDGFLCIRNTFCCHNPHTFSYLHFYVQKQCTSWNKDGRQSAILNPISAKPELVRAIITIHLFMKFEENIFNGMDRRAYTA